MKKLLYASKGWKKLQKEYIDENCFAQRSQKLATVSQQDVTGFSYAGGYLAGPSELGGVEQGPCQFVT